MAELKRSKHLKLEVKAIKQATGDFKTFLGKGGFGSVYKGELTLNSKKTTIAVKKLNRELGFGIKEFLNEIDLLTGQEHQNIITLLGYCDEGEEKLIVYEYAKHGSLDNYIKWSESTYNLSWVKRLKISVDVARGLDHLHRHAGKHQAIIHRDIKSANILLGENYVAKISDLGLSKLSLAGLGRSEVITNPCGTPGYYEPEYVETGIITKESDVFSFGLVLFEVMCGRLCTTRENDGLLLTHNLAKKYYKNKKLDEVINPRLREQMCPSSLKKFSAVAYECLNDDRAKRPPMDVVTKELEETLKMQIKYDALKKEEEYWSKKLSDDSEEKLERLNPPAVRQYSTKKIEHFMLLHKGFFFDDGERPPQVITVVLKLNLHCEACAQKIRKCILRMKGVESVEPDLKNSQVTVKGTFEPPQLVDYVHKRTGKKTVIVNQDPEPKKDDDKGKEDKKDAEEKKDEKKAEVAGDGKEKEEKKDAGGEGPKPDILADDGDDLTVRSYGSIKNPYRKYKFHYIPRENYQELPSYGYTPDPEMFSDENPNACSVM